MSSADGGSAMAAGRKYYAVRVGRDAREPNATPIKSAIFLHWADVHHFVSSDRGAEWAQFDSFPEAEAYLLESKSAKKTGGSAAKETSGSAAGKKKRGRKDDADAKWNAMFDELRAHKEMHGNMLFYHNKASQSKEERALRYWVEKQRREWKQMKKGELSTLSAVQVQRLTELGFNFQPNAEKISWKQRVESLREYKAEHGHAKVPVNSECGGLGLWASNVRQKYRDREAGKKTNLTDERVNELTELGFVFQAGKTPQRSPGPRKSWDGRFQELVAFKEEHGHTVVPQNSGPLGNWVRMQRLAYKKYKKGDTGRKSMTAEKALRLSEIGMVWDASERWKKSSCKEEGSVPDEVHEEV